MNKKNNICFVAGKSGGHILPCLTLAQQHKTNNPESNILFISTDAPLDISILNDKSHISHHITLPLGTFSSTPLYRQFQMLWKLIQSFYTSVHHLRKHKTEKVISSGGLVALPVCLAALLLRIPIELYELNAVPGKAIKTLAPTAHTIHICFAQATKYFTKQCMHTPYPVRFDATYKQLSKEIACKELGLDPHKKTLFIMGGSQGSIQLNNEIKKYIETSNAHNNLQIIHQTGSRDQTDWYALYARNNIQAIVFDYRDAIAPCYAAADLIISRAGAGMLFEILFFEKPSIIIPLEAQTTSHQLDNAYAMATQHPTLFTIIRQDALTDQSVLHNHLDNFLKTSTLNFCAQKNPAQSEA